MSLIRYQIPESTAWRSFDRWSHLRDDLNTLFELPSWSNFGRQGQLFSGWSPALDLYQNNDNVIAVVELPGMRKEDIRNLVARWNADNCRRTQDRKFQRGEGGTLRALYR
jgi:hypothetical protein